MSTIKAFNRQEPNTLKSFKLLNEYILSEHMSVSCYNWFAIRLIFLSLTMMAASISCAIYFRVDEDSVLIALSL
jgi:hypothetical protein